MDMKTRVRALYENKPKTDRELVLEAKDEIATALLKEITIKELFQVLRDCSFKGDRHKFTEILQKLGLWKIRVGHKKPKDPSVSQKADSVSYTLSPTGRKIWGGKNKNLSPQAEDKPKTENSDNPAGATTQEGLEKILGKALSGKKPNQ